MTTLPLPIRAALIGLTLAAPLLAGNEHWSRQFKAAKRVAEMGPGTGMSAGNTKPTIEKAKWHGGRLWMAGAWEAGISAETKKPQRNEYWHLWTWSPVEGWQPFAWFHSAQGGSGPDGKILDFLFLPDGRLVVAGSFTRLDNPGGNQYHRVNALAVWDPKEPTANRWKPLGTFQYNGTISEGGSISALEYDPQGNDLYIGGTFAGMRGAQSPFIHRWDLDTNSFQPIEPGVHGQKPQIYRIQADTRTKPSTIYVAGKFHYTGGDGQSPSAGGTSLYSTGFAAWQEGKGWTSFPTNPDKKAADEGILQRAADFMAFDAVRVFDFLLDGDDIWIVGAFSEGKGSEQPLRGIAKWDRAAQRWIDPTGKGGVGRDVFSIGKGKNGKIYFAGAFGGLRAGNAFFEGLKGGLAGAHCALSFDPKSGAWEALGGGLRSSVMPEVRLAVDGDDVWFVGDFEGVFPVGGDEPGAKPEIESAYVARWNETIDFSADPDGSKARPPQPAPLPALPEKEAPQAAGNERWSRRFGAPPRAQGGKTQQGPETGMDDGQGAPEISAMQWNGDTLYFTGNWQVQIDQRWFVWSYSPKDGWKPLAWQASRGGKSEGPDSPPEGLRWHDGKMYVFGAMKKYSGVCWWDPADGQWHQVRGTFKGQEVEGNAVQARSGPINDVAWDEKTGDMWLVGSSGLGEARFHEGKPQAVGQAIRIDAKGEYHACGNMLAPEDPNKPILGVYCVYIDATKTPSDVYIGGTFNYYGPLPTENSRMAYNVARWDHQAQDWRPVGKGNLRYASAHDEKYYPEGLPGLPAHPGDEFSGFLAAEFARVRCLTMDAQGNLYAGGSVAVVSDTLSLTERKESFGIARWDAKSDTWGPIGSGFQGFSRDVLQMSWLDADTLLVSGGFEYAWDWGILNGVAKLNVRTGALSPLGGGLMRSSRSQVIAPMVVHAIRGKELWFAGLFDHAGVNANSRVEKPNPSRYVAMWQEE